jgi:hypothetical protein
MKQFLTVLMVGAIIWLGLMFKDYVDGSLKKSKQQTEGPLETAPGKAPGMPIQLEESLELAKKGGPDGLRNWLRQHRAEAQDPRLADIDMDYVVLVGITDPKEARRVLNAVGQRIKPGSPVYKRFEQLDKAYR